MLLYYGLSTVLYYRDKQRSRTVLGLGRSTDPLSPRMTLYLIRRRVSCLTQSLTPFCSCNLCESLAYPQHKRRFTSPRRPHGEVCRGSGRPRVYSPETLAIRELALRDADGR